MRIRFVIAVLATGLISAYASASSADAGLRLGLTAGVGVGHMSVESQFDKVKLGGGLSLEISATQRIALRSGAYWRPAGSGLTSYIPETWDSVLRLDYISVPLGATYRFGSSSQWALRAYGAMEWSYLVKAMQSEVDMSGGSAEWEVTSELERWDIAPVLGLSLLTHERFELSLQHSWGLRSVYKDGGDLKNRSLWLEAMLWIDI